MGSAVEQKDEEPKVELLAQSPPTYGSAHCHCPEPMQLAAYSGVALQGEGFQFSEEAQGFMARLLSAAYSGKFRSRIHVSLSDDDKLAFAKSGCSMGADVYGELRPEGFLDMLWQVGARPGDRFYDLGAGTGKLATLAWLAGLHSTGVELSHARWDVSRSAMMELERINAHEQLPQGGTKCPYGFPKRSSYGLDLIWASFLEVDFTDADVLFVSSVMFTKAMVAKMAKIARWMKPGSRIISFHNFAEASQEFEEIGEFHEPTTWKSHTCWRVQMVMQSPSASESRPRYVRPVEDFPAAHHCGCCC